MVIQLVTILMEGLMKKLSASAFDISTKYILNNGRYLEKLLFGHHFISPCPEKIIKAFKMYQNKDGGYGNGIEPDFRMPFSSPMGTSIAIGNLLAFDSFPEAQEQIQNAVQYLESTYNETLMGWEPVSKSVNLFPHAPWWHHTEMPNRINGNPTAELIGYMLRYEKYVTQLDLEMLKEKMIQNFLDAEVFEEHELFCYIRLYNQLSDVDQARMLTQLQVAYKALVNLNPEEWMAYVPYPLKFIKLAEKSIFEETNLAIEENVNFFIDQLTEVGCITPNWNWGAYPSEWDIAKREWTGILTLDALLTLKKYNAIEFV